jgi:extracellular factor (EF) 3-hydroxypalmitic acid methyl ester biosynthesis protein
MSAIVQEDSMLEGKMLLDEAQELLSEGQVVAAFKRLVTGLAEVRDGLAPQAWKDFSRQDCFNHPIRELLHQSPFSRRAFEKPRGYAGDAVVLDFAYGCEPLPEGTTDLGAQIYQCEWNASSVKSARDRRDALASAVDTIARQTGYPKVLSVACGHLREAKISKAVAEGKIADYVALDHDPVSLSVIDRELPGKRITTIHGSVKALIKRQISFHDFDLVYSAGLFDYLTLPVATALTELMFSMLKPGGRLLIANCAPESECIGYMEAFMGWHLIYRNEAELMAFTSSIRESEIKSIGTFRDLHENMIFLEVVKN